MRNSACFSVPFGMIVCMLKGDRLTVNILLKMIYYFGDVAQWLRLKAGNKKVTGSKFARSEILDVAMSKALYSRLIQLGSHFG